MSESKFMWYLGWACFVIGIVGALLQDPGWSMVWLVGMVGAIFLFIFSQYVMKRCGDEW